MQRVFDVPVSAYATREASHVGPDAADVVSCFHGFVAIELCSNLVYQPGLIEVEEAAHRC